MTYVPRAGGRPLAGRAGRTACLALLLMIVFCGAAPLLRAQEPIPIDSRILGVLEARRLGPAATGGRIAALDGVARDPRILYVGTAGGGVWKTTNRGVTFRPVFDDHIQSIGAVTIDQSHPDTVWVGTGEPWVRNSVSIGDGIYKTVDGGKSWTRMGLEKTERIGRIAIDPRKPSTVYAAALGPLWNDDENRGVYRTTDGGSTWERVLFVDVRTGCADLAIDPEKPNILYAAMWQHRRTPWSFNSGGRGSGLHKSTDGGKSWKKLTKGLPEGELGRIAVAPAPSSPNIVYAFVEADKSAFYRSTDRGESWTRGSNSTSAVGRPFYFATMTVDPGDPQRIYKPDFSLAVSTDGGETFGSPYREGGNVHADIHAAWVDPSNSNNIAIGTDGGLYLSNDRGSSWQFVRNLPVSQFYHVSADMAIPYNVYGGLQDNGSWSAPSDGIGGISNSDWKNVGWGDGFHVFADPLDREIVYAESQGGNIMRRNGRTGETKDIKPVPEEGEAELRFNWNTPIALGAMNPGAIYVGSQFVHRSTDRGESWRRISDDLTTNDPAKLNQLKSGGMTVDNSSAENHCTIYAIAESPLEGNTIWAGTDDGNLQVTRDGGKSWTNVVGNIPDLPRNTWCSGVEPGRHDPAVAFATFDGHMTGDMRTYLYKTTDHGATWRSLTTDSLHGYAHVIRQDPVNPHLLFLGTELGLFLTLDGGVNWGRFTGKVPQVAVRDIVIHPRESDVILATHGRGILIIDDITPLRQLTEETLARSAVVLDSRPSVLRTTGAFSVRYGDEEFMGEVPGEAAVITYYLKERHIFGEMKLEILDPDGGVISTLSGTKRRGINRVPWLMRMKPPRVAVTPGTEGRFVTGPVAAEGKYGVRIIKGNDTILGSFAVAPDPNSPHSAAERELRQTTVMKLYGMQADLAYVAESIARVRNQANERAAAATAPKELADELKTFASQLDSLYRTVVSTSEGRLAREEQLRERVIDLYSAVNEYGGAPSGTQLARMKILEAGIAEARTRFDAITTATMERVNSRLVAGGLEPIRTMTREEFDKET